MDFSKYPMDVQTLRLQIAACKLRFSVSFSINLWDRPYKTIEEAKSCDFELFWPSTKLRLFNKPLINRAGGLYGRILTEVVSTNRTQLKCL